MKTEDIVSIDVYEDILQNLKDKKHFSFVRYGDGEWGMMIKKPYDWYQRMGVSWGPEIYDAAEEMKKIILSHPKYIIGIQPSGLRRMEEDIMLMVGEYENLVNANIFHTRSEKDQLGTFFDVLKKRSVILVGNRHLAKLKSFEFQHVETPEDSVWKYNEELKEKIEKCISETKDPVILYSSSFSAKILIDHFYNKYQESITQIDTGSLFDPYVGVLSRSYHGEVIKRLNIPDKDIFFSQEKKKCR
jgi:hypothetical protein